MTFDVFESIISSDEARSKLRELFLSTVWGLKGKACEILTYEQSTLEATFHGWNPDSSQVIVKDLKTPATTIISSALLRTSDILAIHFENIDIDTIWVPSKKAYIPISKADNTLVNHRMLQEFVDGGDHIPPVTRTLVCPPIP